MKGFINIKIAVRSILRNKVQSLVSIVGLGIGLGCIMLITLLYVHENSFDRYIPDNKQVYRIIHGDDCRTPFPLGEVVANEIPGVELYFRYYQNAEFEIRNRDNQIVKEERVACADTSIFNCFGIGFMMGRPAQSMHEVSISNEMAKKYFGSDPAMGQVVEIRLNNDFISMTVCGVYKDFPSNSSLAPNFVAHTDLIGEMLGLRKKQFGEFGTGYDNYKSNWERMVFLTYVKLNPKADVATITNELQKYNEHFDKENNNQQAFSLQPVTDVYLHSADIGGDLFSRRGDARELKYYIAIALLILIIAVANFFFLYKGRLANRLMEIGEKKTLGAGSLSIQKQLLLETNLLTIISLIPAVMVIMAGIPFINRTLGSTLDSNVFSLWYTIPLLLLIILLTGSVSGLFVGMNIIRVSPVLLLNKKTSEYPKVRRWSHSFLGLHFIIFIILTVSVLTLKKQIYYALHNFTAINPKNIIIGELNTPELEQKFDVITGEMEKLPGVVSTAGSSFIPPFNGIIPIRLRTSDETITLDGMIMGKGMTQLLGMQFIDGEPFGDYKPGQVEIIINESAALKYKLKAGDIFNGFKIRGIVKDFTAHTLHNLIQPMVIIQQNPEKLRLFAIKTTGNNDEAIKEALLKLLKDFSPDANPAVYTLTDRISQYYVREQDQAKLISAFALLAVILSVMGLLGMVMINVSQRTKEIGIRKVNGARVSEILVMLNKDFLTWVAIAFVIGCPIAWVAMHKWLENFAYKTSLSWWIFALAGLLALGIALLTVSWQSWRAATRNPVEALRYE